jgi:hypothetical protein
MELDQKRRMGMMKPLYPPPASDNQRRVRTELMEFVRAAENVLSPALLNAELTSDECDLMANYVEQLSQARHPWGKSLRIKYA